jgi:hypothetical protein
MGEQELGLFRYNELTFHSEQVEGRFFKRRFGLDKALDKITQLSEFKLHSSATNI